MNDLEKILKAVDNYPANYRPDVDAGLRKFKQSVKAEKASVLRLRSRSVLAMAASFLMLVASAFWWQQMAYTGSGELLTQLDKQELQLPDGTMVTLNKDTKFKYGLV